MKNAVDTSALLSKEEAGRVSFKAISEEIIEQYKADDLPWIVGFSGGKDSTTLLQLVFYSLLKLQKTETLKKEVHVLCNDTLVEKPAVVRYIDDTLEKIRKAVNAAAFRCRS